MSTEAKKTDAWMPLWIGDYLADTMSLNTAQHGAYLLLLVAYWRNKGPLIDDDEDLAQTVRATPAEWKKLKPKMLKFFDVEGGFWTHSRANKELDKAGLFAQKAHERAKKAAAARWSAKADAQAMQQACLEHATSNAQAVLDSCPTPSPSPSPSPLPSIGIHTDVAKDLNKRAQTSAHADQKSEQPQSPYEACAKAMEAAGLPSVSPAHPKLRALVDAGISRAELHLAARDAASKGKGLPYALATAEGRRADADQQSRSSPSPAAPKARNPVDLDPDSRNAIEADGIALGIGPWVAFNETNGESTPWPVYAARVKRTRAQSRSSPETSQEAA